MNTTQKRLVTISVVRLRMINAGVRFTLPTYASDIYIYMYIYIYFLVAGSRLITSMQNAAKSA